MALVVDLSKCKYSAVRASAIENGWAVKDGPDMDCDLFWYDTSVTITKVHNLKRHQMLNHFEGATEICSKTRFTHNIAVMRAAHPEEYKFLPSTWIIPENYRNLLLERKRKASLKGRMYIVKPDNGSQAHKPENGAKGVFLTSSEKDERIKEARWSFGSTLIVQEYIQNPLVISGCKFDIRLYVLISSCDPLRIYIFHDGLARLCSERFKPADDENKDNHYMHLSNYSINRTHSRKCQSCDGAEGSSGSKRALLELLDTLRREGRALDDLWPQLCDMAVKAAIAVQPILARRHSACRPGDMAGDCCFELLGMDVLLDDSCRPWLLEMNFAPSLQARPTVPPPPPLFSVHVANRIYPHCF
jgi:hypothetical protein